MAAWEFSKAARDEAAQRFAVMGRRRWRAAAARWAASPRVMWSALALLAAACAVTS